MSSIREDLINLMRREKFIGFLYPVKNKDTWRDLGMNNHWDMGILQVAVEKHFNITMSFQEFDSVKNFGSMVRLIKKRTSENVYNCVVREINNFAPKKAVTKTENIHTLIPNFVNYCELCIKLERTLGISIEEGDISWKLLRTVDDMFNYFYDYKYNNTKQKNPINQKNLPVLLYPVKKYNDGKKLGR